MGSHYMHSDFMPEAVLSFTHTLCSIHLMAILLKSDEDGQLGLMVDGWGDAE